MLLAFSCNVYAVEQSAVITLVFPSGSRSLAMGEVGTALADGENVLFYNPAGLGMQNDRWRGGAFTLFQEQLLPVFRIPDLWHLQAAGCYQPRNSIAGGFGVDLNYLNFGENDLTDEQGRITGKTSSYEYVLTGGWGFNFEEIGLENHFFGIGTKFIYSALAPGINANSSYRGTTGNLPSPSDVFTQSGNGIATSVALDIGYIWRFLPFMRLGLNIANMGPSVHYISKDEEDPIPFTINAALAYKDDFRDKSFPKIRFLEISAETRFDREVVKNYADKSPDPFWKAIYTGLLHDTSMTFQEQLDEINIHTGIELKIMNTVSLRQGWLIDKAGQRFENHWGWGFRVFNHFQLDFSYIFSPEGYLGWMFGGPGASGARDGQWGMTFTFFRMFSWSEKDRTWWTK